MFTPNTKDENKGVVVQLNCSEWQWRAAVSGNSNGGFYDAWLLIVFEGMLTCFLNVLCGFLNGLWQLER